MSLGTGVMTDDIPLDEAKGPDPGEAPADDGPVGAEDPGGDAAHEGEVGVHDGESDEPGASPPPLPRRARAWVITHAATVIVGGVALALAVALALTLAALGNRNALGSARVSALAAARTDAVELAGYNYRHLSRDFGVVLAHSTPTFRRSFSQSSNALRSTLTRYHATAAAKVVSAGLVSGSTGRAVALVFLDQTITNSNQTNPTTDRSQVEITLVDSGGRWLIDQVALL